jgi:hypothetical protein
MSHWGKIQFAQVDIPKQPPSLFAYFRCNVVGVALVPALESGRVIGNIYVEPLAIVVKMDAEGGFRHVLRPLYLVFRTCADYKSDARAYKNFLRLEIKIAIFSQLDGLWMIDFSQSAYSQNGYFDEMVLLLLTPSRNRQGFPYISGDKS